MLTIDAKTMARVAFQADFAFAQVNNNVYVQERNNKRWYWVDGTKLTLRDFPIVLDFMRSYEQWKLVPLDRVQPRNESIHAISKDQEDALDLAHASIFAFLNAKSVVLVDDPALVAQAFLLFDDFRLQQLRIKYSLGHATRDIRAYFV